jgi:hypothetical protein
MREARASLMKRGKVAFESPEKGANAMRAGYGVTAVLLTLGLATGVAAQNPPQETPKPLEVGAVAPDFALTGATRYGVLRDQVKLSDYKGKTVVLAFFFRARTRG